MAAVTEMDGRVSAAGNAGQHLRYIQFGCGLCAPATWVNFDAGPAFWMEKNLPFLKPMLLKRGFPDYPANIQYGDVIKGLPVAAGSAAGVYCSHVLEHLALNEFRQTLRNVFAYLARGGTFRFVLPDLEWLARNYVSSSDTEAASAGFVDIRRARFHDNPDPRFQEVEDLGRWENCLGVECRKP
jgi:hypothetical protein